MKLVVIAEELRLEWRSGPCVCIITVMKRHHQRNKGHMITHVKVNQVSDIWVGVRTTRREKTLILKYATKLESYINVRFLLKPSSTKIARQCCCL